MKVNSNQKIDNMHAMLGECRGKKKDTPVINEAQKKMYKGYRFSLLPIAGAAALVALAALSIGNSQRVKPALLESYSRHVGPTLPEGNLHSVGQAPLALPETNPHNLGQIFPLNASQYTCQALPESNSKDVGQDLPVLSESDSPPVSQALPESNSKDASHKLNNCAQITDLMNDRSYCPTEFFNKYFMGPDDFTIEEIVPHNRALFSRCWDAKELDAAKTNFRRLNNCNCNPSLEEKFKEFISIDLKEAESNYIDFYPRTHRGRRGYIDAIASSINRVLNSFNPSLLANLGCSFEVNINKACKVVQLPSTSRVMEDCTFETTDSIFAPMHLS